MLTSNLTLGNVFCSERMSQFYICLVPLKCAYTYEIGVHMSAFWDKNIMEHLRINRTLECIFRPKQVGLEDPS